jgi:hypothetical protein
MTNDNLYRTIGNIEQALKNLDSKVTAMAADVKKYSNQPAICDKLFVHKESSRDLATKGYVKIWCMVILGLLTLLIVSPDLVKEALERLVKVMF